MPEHMATRVILVTLNTQGIPKRGSRLRGRYAAIGAAVDAGDADVACFPRTPGIARVTRQRASRKGALVTLLARTGLCVINTHLAANTDGDWSAANRHYPLHQAQLGALARVVRGVPGAAVVCGDFNVDRDSELFGEFATGTGLADAFGGRCPATFRAEFLPAGKSPHCIDFILTAGKVKDGVKAETASMEFAGRQPLPGGPGYVCDHIGLRASLLLAPP